MTFKKKPPANKAVEANSRQRSTATMTATDAATKHVEMDSRESNADTRPARIPLGYGYNLDTSGLILDKENYYHRWFFEMSNSPGTIAGAKAAYYEHVTIDGGNNVTRPGKGAGMHYLMRLPMKYRLEDLALKNKLVLDTMDQEAQIGPGEYAPDPITLKSEGGLSAIRRELPESLNPYNQ